MKRSFLVASFLALAASFVFAQGNLVPPQVALKTVNGITSPVANATITVCPANSSGIPCTPASIAIFSDAGLTHALPNPFQADAQGNYIFGVASGSYTVTVSGAGFSGYSYQITANSAGAGANCTPGTPALPYFNGSSNLCDQKAALDGAGNMTVQSSIWTPIPIANLATLYPNPFVGQHVTVPDPQSGTDCAIGGGTSLPHDCEWTGFAWVSISGGSGSVTFPITLGQGGTNNTNPCASATANAAMTYQSTVIACAPAFLFQGNYGEFGTPGNSLIGLQISSGNNCVSQITAANFPGITPANYACIYIDSGGLHCYLINGGGNCNPGGGNVSGPASSTNNDLPKFADTTGKLLSDSGILASLVVTDTGGGATAGDIAIFSGTGNGSNGIADSLSLPANQLLWTTGATSATRVRQVCQASSILNNQCAWQDLRDVKIIPLCASPGGTASAGATYASGQWSAANRAGTNNIGCALQAIPSTGAALEAQIELPADWVAGVSAAQPFIRLIYASGANTSGTVIWTVSSACSKEDGSVTDDPAFNAESAFASQTMTAANRMWGQNGQFTLMTSGNNCIAGSPVIIKIALSGTAASAINFYQAIVSIPVDPISGQSN